MVSEEQHEIKVLLEIHIEDTTTQMHEPVKNYCFRVLPDNRRTTLPTLQTLADKAFSHMSDLGSRVGKHVRYQLLSAEYQDSSFSKKCVAFEQDPVFANLGDSGRLANYELKVRAVPETSRTTPVPEIPVSVQRRPPQSMFSRYGNVDNIPRMASNGQGTSRPKPSIPKPESSQGVMNQRFQVVQLSKPSQNQHQNQPAIISDNEDWDYTPPQTTYQRDTRRLNAVEDIESTPSESAHVKQTNPDFVNAGFGSGTSTETRPYSKPEEPKPNSENATLDKPDPGFFNSGFSTGAVVQRPYSRPPNPKAENCANIFGSAGADFGKASKVAMQAKNQVKETQPDIQWSAILPQAENEAKAQENVGEEEKFSSEPEQKVNPSVAMNLRKKRETLLKNLEIREQTKTESKPRTKVNRPQLEYSDTEDEEQNDKSAPISSQSQTISVDSTQSGNGSSNFSNGGSNFGSGSRIGQPRFPSKSETATQSCPNSDGSDYRPKSVPPKYGFGMSPESMLMKAAFSADSGIGRLQGSFGNGRVNRNSYRPRNPNHRHREEERPPVSSNTTNGNQQRAVIDLNEPWQMAAESAKPEENTPEDGSEPSAGKQEIVFDPANEDDWGGPAW